MIYCVFRFSSSTDFKCATSVSSQLDIHNNHEPVISRSHTKMSLKLIYDLGNVCKRNNKWKKMEGSGRTSFDIFIFIM